MLRSRSGKHLTDDTLTKVCEINGYAIPLLPGQRRINRLSIVTALVHRVFHAEDELTRRAIIDSLCRSTVDMSNKEVLAECIDALPDDQKRDFDDIKNKIRVASDGKSSYATHLDFTPPQLKELVPPGAVIVRMGNVCGYEGCDRPSKPRVWISRRWGGPIAKRSEEDALWTIVSSLWDIRQSVGGDASNRPSRLTVDLAVAALHSGAVLSAPTGHKRKAPTASLAPKPKAKRQAKQKAAPSPVVPVDDAANPARARGRGRGRGI